MNIPNMPQVTLYLGDYLGPGGKKPYDQLAGDMEKARTVDRVMVTVLDVPHFVMCIGIPDDGEEILRPWYSSQFNKYYVTAKDCLDDRDGWSWEEEEKKWEDEERLREG